MTSETQTATQTAIHGDCDERFSSVRDAFAANFATGEEIGASVAVTIEGKTVVDLWAGKMADPVDGVESADWERDTIVNVWSTTKTMVGTCMLMLADQGKLDFNASIAQYWPQFAANGKEDVLVRHMMGHTAGMAGWAEPVEVEDLYDWDKITGLLAAQPTFWQTGDRSGYHAITLGYLQGEILRRITGQTVGQFFAEHVAGPLGADFHIGLDESNDDRVATLRIPELELGQAGVSEFTAKILGNPMVTGAEPETSAWRRAEIPAAGGHGNARSVARVLSALACGGTVDGVTLMSPAGLEAIFEVQAAGVDRILGEDIKLGMGFGLTSPSTPLPSERAFYWGGWGGSLAVVDLDQKMSFSYVMNKMHPTLDGDMRSANLLLAAYGSVMS